jgi:hypothetical protein
MEPALEVPRVNSQAGVQLLEAPLDFLPQCLTGLQQSQAFGKYVALGQETSFGDHASNERRQIGWNFGIHS